MENLDELSIDQLYEGVVAENWALLEQTLEILDQIVCKAGQMPAQAAALLLLAQPLWMQFDVRKQQHDGLQESWGLWRARGFFDKRLQAKEERAGLMRLFAEHEKWRKTLQEVGDSLNS